jgi:sugar phosphate permease
VRCLSRYDDKGRSRDRSLLFSGSAHGGDAAALSQGAGIQGIGERTIDKLTWRFVPFLIVCYLFAYLDRVNLSFAAPDMSRDLGFSASNIGTGAGMFFLSYFLLEVPSSLALERFGARRWITRIMMSWGVLAGAMAFVDSVEHFYVMRLLLGAAEAGFFPCVI